VLNGRLARHVRRDPTSVFDVAEVCGGSDRKVSDA